MSAEADAGPRQQGKKADRAIADHSSQTCRVAFEERGLRVNESGSQTSPRRKINVDISLRVIT
jgi:hypothetical protein